MIGLRLTLKTPLPPGRRVDARGISIPDPLDDARRQCGLLAGQPLAPGEGPNITVGELFELTTFDAPVPVIRIVGNLDGFDFLAFRHRTGQFRVEGNVGNHFAAEMSGGVARVDGNAGSHVGAPAGTRSSGMSGGRVEIAGDAGGYLGTRMRRGEIFVDGRIGDFAAASMIAGTIVSGTGAGRDLGFGMRRGTVVVPKLARETAARMTDPITVRSLFPRLIRFRPWIPSGNPNTAASCGLDASPGRRFAESNFGESTVSESKVAESKVAELLARLGRGSIVSRRGDLAVGGQGEIWTPEQSADAP